LFAPPRVRPRRQHWWQKEEEQKHVQLRYQWSYNNIQEAISFGGKNIVVARDIAITNMQQNMIDIICYD